MIANLLSLYSSILVPVLSEWITEWDLCRLDCAVSNAKLREMFLRLLSWCYVANVENGNSYLCKIEWIAMRQLGIRNLNLLDRELLTTEVQILSALKQLESVTVFHGRSLGRLVSLCPVIRSLNAESKIDAIADILRSVQGLHQLTAQQFIPDFVSGDIARLCPHLRCISFGDAVDATSFIENCSELTSVNVKYLNSVVIALTQSTTVRHLTLRQREMEDLKPAPDIQWKQWSLLSVAVMVFYVGNDYVINIAQSCPLLTSLEVSGPKVSDIAVKEIANGCPSLVKLRIGVSVSDDGVLYLIGKCKLIESLNISWNRAVSDRSVRALLRDCKHLTYLNVEECNVVDALKDAFVACPTLTDLMDLDIRSMITNIQSMEYLKLAAKRVEMSTKWRTSARLRITMTLPALDDYESIFQHCPQLVELDVSPSGFGEYCTDSLVYHLLQHCPLLTALQLYSGLSEWSVKAITSSGIRLQKLGLTSIAFRGDSLIQLLQSQPQLRKLSFVTCTGFPSGSLQAIVEYCSRLTSFVMQWNKEIKSRDVEQLLRGCTLLHSIDLEGCSSVTSEVVDTIVDLGRKMILVSVKGCNIVSKVATEFTNNEDRPCIACFFD